MSQTIYLRSATSTVDTGGPEETLDLTDGTAVTTVTSIETKNVTGTFIFEPGVAKSVTTAGSNQNHATTYGWLFDAQPTVTYASGTWTVNVALNSSNGGTMSVSCQLWVVTKGQLTGADTVANLGTATSATFTPPSTGYSSIPITFTQASDYILPGQYLYLQLYLNVTVASSSHTNTVTIALDDSAVGNSSIVTPAYTTQVYQNFGAGGIIMYAAAVLPCWNINAESMAIGGIDYTLWQVPLNSTNQTDYKYPATGGSTSIASITITATTSGGHASIMTSVFVGGHGLYVGTGSSGNYTGNGVIRLYTVSLTTAASTWTDASINEPTGIFEDSSGTVWASDGIGGNIYKFPSGGATASSQTFVANSGGVSSLWLDSSGNIYCACGTTGVLKFTNTGTVVTLSFTGIGSARSVCLDSAGNIYVADATNNHLAVFASTGGAAIKTWPNHNPYALTIDALGYIYGAQQDASGVSAVIFKYRGLTVQDPPFNPWPQRAPILAQ